MMFGKMYFGLICPDQAFIDLTWGAAEMRGWALQG